MDAGRMAGELTAGDARREELVMSIFRKACVAAAALLLAIGAETRGQGRAGDAAEARKQVESQLALLASPESWNDDVFKAADQLERLQPLPESLHPSLEALVKGRRSDAALAATKLLFGSGEA